MSERIFPRSPRERMDGWAHLPRYIDKIRLHLAGRLHPDYQPNFGKGFDGMWLKAAGVGHDQMIELVQRSVCDGQVCDWVRRNVTKTPAQKEAHAAAMFSYPSSDNPEARERLRLRKQQAGLESRDDVQTFIDLIEADEGRI